MESKEVYKVCLLTKNNKRLGFYLYGVIVKVGDKYYRSESIKSYKVLSKKDIDVNSVVIGSEIKEMYYSANGIVV